MIVLETSELGLLHHVGHERSSRAKLFVDFKQPAHRRELDLFDVAGAVAAKFPIVSEREMYGWFHVSKISHRDTESPRIAALKWDEAVPRSFILISLCL